jgi:acyl dehydratase
MPPTVYHSVEELTAAVGTVLGPTDWMVVDRDRVTLFADATDDHQWIHVDEARAAGGPFGGTIAHGFLTLSLLPTFLNQLRTVENVRLAVNYGLNKVRFPAAVPVGARLQATSVLTEVMTMPDASIQVVSAVEVVAERIPKPVCVAEFVTRYFLAE